MIRIAKILGLLVWAMALVLGAPAPAHADPISAAIITAFGFTATASAVTAVTSFLINAAFAVGASLVSKLTRKSTLQERQASVTTLSLGEVPREAVLGEVCTAGSLIDIFNHGGQYGTDNVTRCVALADHMLTSIVGYYVDDSYYAWSGSGVQAGFSGCLTIDFVNASMDGAAPPARITAIASAGWGATDTLAGVSHVWITTKFDEKVWTQGHPTLKFVVRGLPVYDPRKDAALGYVGANPHVWSNPATHAFSNNAALLRYAYVRGIYAVGRQGQAEHLLIGRGLTAEEAPPARIIAAANLCDELVSGAPRYTAAGVISADEAFIEVEEKFAAAMAGVIVQREGGVEVEPGQAKAVVATITDADLVVGAPVSFSAFMPDTEQGRINTVVPRYIEPAQAWKDHAGPVRRSLTDIAADNGPREITLSLDLVTRGVQADWCAEVIRLLSRLERRGTIVLPPRFGHLEEGDWIAWQSDRRHAGATVRYRIESWALNEGWRNQLVLREIASSVYGVADPLPDTSSPPPPPPVVDALQLLGVSAEAITLPGETSVIPAVRFRWDAPVDAAVRAIRAEVRRAGETEAAPTRTEDVNAGVMVVTNGVGGDQTLEVRLVPIGDPTRPVLVSNWITVTTGALIAGGMGGEDAANLFERFEDIAESILRIGYGARQLQEHVDIRTWIDGKDIGTYVVDRFVTVEEDNYALASQIIFLGARTDEAQAYNYREFVALATDLQALAYSHEVLSAEYGDTSADLGFLLEVMAGPGGGSALMALYTDVNGYIAGGYFLNDGTTADMVWLADRFGIGSPGRPGRYPFLLVDDDLYLTADVHIDGSLNLMPGTVLTGAVADNAITGSVQAQSLAAITLSGSSNLVQSATLTSTGGRIAVMPSFLLALHHPGGGGFSFRLRLERQIGATIVDIWAVTPDNPNDDFYIGWQTFTHFDTPPAGAVTYRAYVDLITAPGDFSVKSAKGRTLQLMEYKK